uniref:Major facilitator superfamily domain-containing protein 8-like n=1 Tax=Sinocyclocheilus anshuiensis TaxID=1608454 RepID=A0A671NPH6_9TELE
HTYQTESKMDYRRKRRLTFFTIGLIFLLSGIEYAVILPTIWRYLQTLNAAPYFLGLSLSAFSFSGLLAGPLFGFWSDRTLSTKKIILFANVFEMVGNFMYFMGYSRWLLLCSRLVAGIGTGAGSSIFGFLTRNTAPEDRSTVFAAVMACRQAGLLIGPAFNLFLRLCNFQIGPFTVNKYTSPGLFMCLLWILLQFVVLFMYWDFTPQDETRQRNGVEREEVEQEEEEEGKPLVGPNELTGSYGTVTSVQSRASSVANGDVTHVSPLPSLPPEETMVTPLTQKFFNFGELENSIMYCVCGVEVIAGFLFVRWLSKRVAERVVLAVGLILCNISCVWCLIFLANPQGGFAWQLAEFIIGVFLQVLGLPFVAVAQVSLFSKITSEKTQGFSQGIRRSVGGLATILGPLWAGGLTFNLYIMLGLMMGLLALLTVSPDAHV